MEASLGYFASSNFCRASDRSFEKQVLNWYSKLVEHLLDLEKTSVDKDLAEMETTVDWQHKMAILYRLEQKRIL